MKIFKKYLALGLSFFLLIIANTSTVFCPNFLFNEPKLPDTLIKK